MDRDPAGENALDEQVRRGDEDRWLASRFVADPARRAELVALYALNLELARAPLAAKTPMLGVIRLRWWADGLAEVAQGQAARAPVLQALRAAAESGRLDRALIERMTEARQADAEREAFTDEAELTRYLDDTAGALMLAAARLLAPETPAEATLSAGRAWGWVNWLRARSALQAAGRNWAPLTWGEASSEEEQLGHVGHRVGEALGAARAELRRLPSATFSAVAYAALAAAYARGVEPGPLSKRLRLTWAVLQREI